MDNESIDLERFTEVGDRDFAIVVERGANFTPSPRLAAALEDLSRALAEQELDEVAGFSFEPQLAMGTMDGPVGESAFGVGCIRVGCIKDLGCNGRTGCTKVVVKKSVDTFSF